MPSSPGGSRTKGAAGSKRPSETSSAAAYLKNELVSPGGGGRSSPKPSGQKSPTGGRTSPTSVSNDGRDVTARMPSSRDQTGTRPSSSPAGNQTQQPSSGYKGGTPWKALSTQKNQGWVNPQAPRNHQRRGSTASTVDVRPLTARDGGTPSGTWRKGKQEAADLPPAGFLPGQRLGRKPNPMPYCVGTFEYAPPVRRPSNLAPSISSSQRSGNTAMSGGEFEETKEQLGHLLWARHKSVTEAFRKYDEDKTGDCSKRECYKLLMKPFGYNKQASDRFFNAVDTDRGGFVSLGEFKEVFAPFIQPTYELRGYKDLKSTAHFIHDPSSACTAIAIHSKTKKEDEKCMRLLKGPIRRPQ